MSVSGVLRAPVEKLRTSKRLARMSADCLVWVVALYVAALMRLDFNVTRVHSFDLAILFIPAIMLQAATGYWTGLYRGWWINGSFEEVAALARATAVTTLALAGIDLVSPGNRPARPRRNRRRTTTTTATTDRREKIRKKRWRPEALLLRAS